LDQLITEWQARIRAAAEAKGALRIRGGGSKDFYGQALAGEIFDTTAYRGIVAYDPTELVITARAGTPLAEMETTMREHGQMLAFEPPHFGANATIGGCIASGLSGPRRPYAGAVRDLVLGVRVLDGKGDDLRFGGQVMKNVAGFDVSRLMVGALGTLGVILDVSIKCLPLPKAETTLVFALPANDAVRKVNECGGQPLPISASMWHAGRLHLRLSGAQSAVSSAQEKLGGELLQDADAFWTSIREQTHAFFAKAGEEPGPAMWRLSVKSTAAVDDLGGEQLVEWGGALRWLKAASGGDAARIREWAKAHGGHATLFRAADKRAGAFQPLSAPLLAIHQRLKATFDPAGIFNPGRMYREF
jgi:glycolate oxidase FAD binding subunit